MSCPTPFSFDPNPLRRHTFWSITIGGTFLWTSVYGINQAQVQRYISCKSLFHAKMWALHQKIILEFTLKKNVMCNWTFLCVCVCLSLSRALYINLMALCAISLCSVFCGLCLYSVYKNCDPLTANKVSAQDQVRHKPHTSQIECNNIIICECIDAITNQYATSMSLSLIYNKLMPYLVLDILSEYPGLPGLFVAAAYSGTLRFVFYRSPTKKYFHY